MPVHSRRYFQIVELKPSEVNPTWKVFHACLFILLAATSFMSAFTLHDIFDSFNFQCTLYAKAEVKLELIQVIEQNVTESPEPDYSTIEVTNSNGTVTEKEPMMLEIVNEQYLVSNSSLTAYVEIDLQKTTFGSRRLCNSVLFYYLSAMFLATFFAVLVMICGRGGRGYRTDLYPHPWLYVYPLAVLSAIMLIANSVIASYLHNGMTVFCSAFHKYTGNKGCSNEMRYFMKENGFGSYDFYQMYFICLIGTFAGIILWTAQLVLFIFRVFCFADFRLLIVTVSSNRRRSLGIEEDKLHPILMEHFEGMRKVALVGEHIYTEEPTVSPAPSVKMEIKPGRKKVRFIGHSNDESSNNKSSSGTQAEKALKKKHKLKKNVSFSNINPSKDDHKDDDDETTPV